MQFLPRNQWRLRRRRWTGGFYLPGDTFPVSLPCENILLCSFRLRRRRLSLRRGRAAFIFIIFHLCRGRLGDELAGRSFQRRRAAAVFRHAGKKKKIPRFQPNLLRLDAVLRMIRASETCRWNALILAAPLNGIDMP